MRVELCDLVRALELYKETVKLRPVLRRDGEFAVFASTDVL